MWSAWSSPPSPGWGPSTRCCATWPGIRSSCRSGCTAGRPRGRSSGGARIGRRCRSCCTTRSMPGTTPTAAARSSRAGRCPVGPAPGESSDPPASGWCCCRAGCPHTSPPGSTSANVARLAANRQTAATPGAPRDGSALLSGLLRCGRCGGHRMSVRLPRRPGCSAMATCAPSSRSTTGPAGLASTSPAPPSMPTSPGRCSRRWRRRRWRFPWPLPHRPRASGPCWTSSGASGSNAPATPPTGPAASTSSPSRKTASSPGSWKLTGKPRSPMPGGWKRSTSGSPRNCRRR